MIVCLREVRVQLYHLGGNQESKEGVQGISVCQEYALRASCKVAHISANKFKGLSIINLANIGFNIPSTED